MGNYLKTFMTLFVCDIDFVEHQPMRLRENCMVIVKTDKL